MITPPAMTLFPTISTTPASVPMSVAVPVIKTRAQLEALLENIALLQNERDELQRAQENEIAAVRHRYRAPLAEIDHYLQLETGWAETWARQNRATFVSVDSVGSMGSVHSVDYKKMTLGFRADPPRIERASRRWTWTRIAHTLATLPWGRRYLRIPAPEVNKDALAADLATLSLVDLRNAGMVVTQGERFFISPSAELETSAESNWQEAA
jgi:phage host-nuclease inhibitor protein Gam